MSDGEAWGRLLAASGDWVWSLNGAGQILPPERPGETPPPPQLGAVAGQRLEDLLDDSARGDQAAIRGALVLGEPITNLTFRALPPRPGLEEAPAPQSPTKGPWFRLTAVPRVPGDPGQGWVGVCRAMGRERELERALRDSRTRAEASAQAKYRFLATMSHELRTPMTSILGASQLLSDGRESEEQALFLKTIREAGHTMMGVLNDIIDLAKVEDGKLTPTPEPTRVQALVDGIMVIMAGAAESKGLALESVIDPTVPPVLSLDSTAVRRILLNLLGNAIKFTSAGSVTLSLRLDGATHPDRARLAFTVTDTGIGIPEALHEAIFDPFSQVDPLVSRGVGGSGLGLTISRRLAESMDGTLSVVARPARGSTFTLRLEAPVLADDPEPDRPATLPSSVPRRSLRILLAEDVPLNRVILTRMVERDGHRVRAVGDGASAVAAMAMDQFDLVLMDTRMPGMDGLEATRRIRALPDPAKATLPIIALTANMMPEDAILFREAGMDGVIHKPLEMDALYRVLAPLFEQAPRPPKTAPEPALPAAGLAGFNAAPAPVSEIDGPPLVDEEMIGGYVDILGLDGVTDLVAVFESQGTGMAQSLRDQLREGAVDNLVDTTHRLTSAAGSLALTRLRELARAAEDAARDDRFADLDPLVNRIPLVVAQSLDSLRAHLGRLRREADRSN